MGMRHGALLDGLLPHKQVVNSTSPRNHARVLLGVDLMRPHRTGRRVVSSKGVERPTRVPSVASNADVPTGSAWFAFRRSLVAPGLTTRNKVRY